MEIKKTDILLETGTNELEVLEFIIAGDSFGINVAKVRELMQYKPVQRMPKSHPCIEGIFQPRDLVLTIIDLAAYLGLPASEDPDRDIFIIAGFNNMNLAFHVHSVESIHRISWEKIEKPDSTIYGGSDGVVTGIAKVDGRMISIIDFEKIVHEISPETGIQMSEIEAMGERANVSKPIIIAEDSKFLKAALLEALHAAGYSNIIACDNGKEAWDALGEIKAECESQEDVPAKVSCVITDIEMPQMDGLRLTKLIKDDKLFKIVPVIIFSSLIDAEMSHKCKEVGADAQLTKPEIGNLVHVLDEHIL